MPSSALNNWSSERKQRLDELLALRNRAVGTSRGRKWGVREYNKLYVSKVAAEFQSFCRDLHSESRTILVAECPRELRPALKASLSTRLVLTQGNAHPGSLGDDFGRFGVSFIDELKQTQSRSIFYLWRLEKLNALRNAIAHEDEPAMIRAEAWLRVKHHTKSGKTSYPTAKPNPGTTHKPFTLTDAKHLYRDVNHLATVMDATMSRQLRTLTADRAPSW